MSNVPSLQVLAHKRQALLLAEMAALLHDIGKLSSQFIDQMSHAPIAHSKNFEHENAVETIQDFVDAAFLQVLKDKNVRGLLHWNNIKSNEQIGQLLDLILHHDNPKHSALLVRLLNCCDGADSGADKGTTRQGGLPKEAKQESANTFIATAFGNESKLDEANLDTARLALSKYVGAALLPLQRSDCLQRINDQYSSGLAETRRAANDVTLWDHSFSVGTLYKTSLAAFLLKGALDLAQLRWRLLRVNFDVLGLYANAIKIADLLAYQRAVRVACKVVKHLVEWRYPLGNEIYRDTTGIYFTFPDIDLPADLAQEIRRRVETIDPELTPRVAVEQPQGNTTTEQLKRMLADARNKAQEELAYPFTRENFNPCWQQQWDNLPQGKWELCPVCRLRPMEEGAEACETCLQRRGSRIAWWQKHPQQTIWIDEIADHNDRLALIVGKFGLDDWLSGDLVQTMLVKADQNNPGGCVPKNPSPARLRRVWETCQRFWTETVEKEILAKLPQRTRWELIPEEPLADNSPPKKIALDGTLNGQPISAFRINDRLLTISFVTQPQKGTLTITWEGKGRKQQADIVITQTKVAQDKLEKYQSHRPFLPLLASPDQFLALVPAADALDIARQMEEQYRRQMGKVQNRLPLFLGLVFFPRKLPLVAVMDTARRMLEGVSLTTEQWEIAEDVHNGKVKFTNGLEWNVSTVMGDGTTEDVWYPYWRVEGKPTDRGRWFVGPDNEHWVHLNELRKGDVVALTPSRFAYLFLESTAGRFRFDPERDALLLVERQRLQDLWQAICTSPEMTDTKLQAISALFERKRQEWDLPFPTPQNPIADETFRRLVETTLKRDNVQVRAEEVLNGCLQRAVDLHLHVLKRRVKDFLKKEAQDEGQQKATL